MNYELQRKFIPPPPQNPRETSEYRFGYNEGFQEGINFLFKRLITFVVIITVCLTSSIYISNLY